MNPFKTQNHEAIANHLLHLNQGDADIVPHLAHADYLEENGYPLYAHIVRKNIEQSPPDSFGLSSTSFKDDPIHAGEPHSHHVESDDPSHPISIEYKDGKNLANVNYMINQHKSAFSEKSHPGLVYPATLPLEEIIKHAHAQYQENPTEDTGVLLDELSKRRPKLYDAVLKEPHKYAKDYENVLCKTKEK